MTENSPLTPPTALIKEWMTEFYGAPTAPGELPLNIASRAAQWGADRQLEADAEWLDQYSLDAPHLTIIPTGKGLVEAMRPKPPSLKEQALQELDKVDMLWATEEFGKETLNSLNTIRKALKALPND